ncbi:hypothetical protein V5799_012837 [Amblyomma americanum]|uniref:DDE Tnp4 domain-containing protein n=1 Tax=Amblyomma americanum TaxID=6943 RepID=A0AAQ4E7I1_AMBAM
MRVRRSIWVRPAWLRRKQESEYHTLFKVMREQDPELFFKYYRMTPELFDLIHGRVRERLTKMHVVQEPISSGERLAMTLRYLCSGNAIVDIAKDFRVGLETAREAIHLTLQVLWDDLAPQYMKPPNDQMWRNIADGFWKRWQFPNCLGSVDGKHVQIVAPANSGSLYYNYKGTFSIVLMAVVDSGYLFRLVDVGAPGRISDGGVFKRSPIGRKLHAGLLQLPSHSQLPGSNKTLPFAFIGDEAFQLREDFMRPFPGSREDPAERIFNYRLSRARCVFLHILLKGKVHHFHLVFILTP